MKPLRTLGKVASKLAPGRAPYFIEAHLVKALKIVDSEGPVGRVRLSKILGLGEGAVRTLVKHLKNEGLIKISRTGIILTDSGKKLSSFLNSRISSETEVPQSSLTVGPFNIAVLVKNVADAIKYGLEQRDAAIKVGASGATTLIFSHGSLVMPGAEGEDVFKNIPAIRDVLISKLKPREGDVVIIGSGNDRLTAELGAIAAALETLKSAGDP